MILDLHQQGLTVSAISRETGIDRKTVRKYIERGLEAPVYGPRKPRATVIDPFASYLRERVKAYPGLTGSRLFRELRERGYKGGYTAVTDFLRDVRPPASQGFEVRFETPPGEPTQVDFAQFHVIFTDEPMTPRIVWLFSMVLGHSPSSGRASSCIRTCRRSCAAISLRSKPFSPRQFPVTINPVEDENPAGIGEMRCAAVKPPSCRIGVDLAEGKTRPRHEILIGENPGDHIAIIAEADPEFSSFVQILLFDPATDYTEPAVNACRTALQPDPIGGRDAAARMSACVFWTSASTASSSSAGVCGAWAMLAIMPPSPST